MPKLARHRMSIIGTIRSNRSRMAMGAFLTILVGLALWRLPSGEGWVNASYDWPCLFSAPPVSTNVVIIGMDQASHDALGISYGQWPRSVHAHLLDRLRTDGCRLVVFDVAFMGTNAPAEDNALRDAIRRQSRIVLAAVRTPNPNVNFTGEYTWRPTNFLAGAARWGLVGAELDRDRTARRLFTGREDEPSLAWVAAEEVGARLPTLTTANHQRFWIRYHGSAGTIRYLSYHLATNQPPGFFHDKIVFIGGKPSPLFLDEKSDLFRTPFTAWTGQLMPGVEILATMFLNLKQHEFLRRTPAWGEFAVLLLVGLFVGAGFSVARPLSAIGWAVAGMAAVALAGVGTFHFVSLWWPWTVVAGAQIPCAVAWSVFYRAWGSQPVPSGAAPAESVTAHGPYSSTSYPRPAIPEHTLIRRIGGGAYGEVWLARDLVGSYKAVKVVHLSRFQSEARPFDREYRGLSAYAPISLSHPSLLHVLFVGRREEEGYFYYIMELGDDRKSGEAVDPPNYVPRNLDYDLEERKRFPVVECIDLVQQLAGALEHLHRHGLVHRDIKPSNIVFVKGVPKLADIGLVTPFADPNQEVSYVGTEGYISPEGPGSPAADIYSLGVVLYRMSTGLGAKDFPALPETLAERTDFPQMMQLNNVIMTACDPAPARRFPSAAALQTTLLQLQQRLPCPGSETAAG